MFAISILQRESDSAVDGAVGRILVGDFSENFPISVSTHDLAALERSWHEALGRLVAGEASAALRTTDSSLWCLYRSGDDIFVQQQLCVPGWQGQLDSAGNVIALPERCTVTEDGDPISEWQVQVGDINEFLRGVAV